MNEDILQQIFEEDKGLDYTNVTDDQKVAIRECVKIIREYGLHDIGTSILERIGLESIPEYDLDESDFFKLLKENNIYASVQGHVRDGEMKYPLLLCSADIREFDKALLNYKHKNKRKLFG